MALMSETPAVEMAANRDATWRGQKPVKNRRRILCPTLPPAADRSGSQGSRTQDCSARRAAASRSPEGRQPSSRTQAPPRPFTATVRILYFSRDGAQADNGATHEFQVTSATTAEELLLMMRAAAEVKSGKLVFRMQPVNLSMTLEEAGTMKDPKAFHLVLSRKFRPPDVDAEAEN